MRIRKTKFWDESEEDPIPVFSDETYHYTPYGDKRYRWRQMHSLFDFGIRETDPRIQDLNLSDLIQLDRQLRGEFWEQEKAWLLENFTSDEMEALGPRFRADKTNSISYGHFINCAYEYGSLAEVRSIPLEIAWKLADRGLQLAPTALDRYLCNMGGLRAGNLIDDAWNTQYEQKRLSYAAGLREARPAAAEDFIYLWGERPPRMGENYDFLEYTQASNRIQKAYRYRETVDGALDQAIAGCCDMISRSPEFLARFQTLGIDPPKGHHGYHQLSVILNRQQRWQEAIDLYEQAIAEGWPGDWAKRLATSQRKLQQKSRN